MSTVTDTGGRHSLSDAKRLANEVDQALPEKWSENVVDHPQMKRWRDELLFRIWKHKVLLRRIGCVGPDWEQTVDEVDAFTFANASMVREIERRSASEVAA